jgi:hypothetical protein
MSTPSINDLLPRLLVEVPGAPLNLMLDQLRQAWRAFCVEAEAWRPTCDLTLVQNQRLYDLVLGDPAPAAEVQRLDGAFYLDDNGEPTAELAQESYEFVDGVTPKVRFASPPQGGELRRVRMVLAPLFGTTEFNLDLIMPYAEPVIAKAAAEMLLLPKRNWTDPKRAAVKLADYRAGKGYCRRSMLVQRYGNSNITV